MTNADRKRRRLRWWLMPLAVFLQVILLAACTSNRCDTPFGMGGQFDLSLPAYSPLANVGAMVIYRDSYGLEVGHRGIYVRRVTLNEFIALEITCPNDHDVALAVDPENDMLLRCPVCSSAFETIYGNPIEGSATPCPLYQYSTDYDGRMLLIY